MVVLELRGCRAGTAHGRGHRLATGPQLSSSAPSPPRGRARSGGRCEAGRTSFLSRFFLPNFPKLAIADLIGPRPCLDAPFHGTPLCSPMMKMLLLSLFSISAAFHIGAMRVERPSTCSLNRHCLAPNRHLPIVVASAPDETVAEEEGEVCADLYGLSKLGCEVKEAIINAIGGDPEAVEAVTAAINIEEVAEEEDTAENEGTAEEDEAAEAEPAAVDQATEEDDDEEMPAEEVAEEAAAEEVAEEEVAEEDTASVADLEALLSLVGKADEETADEVIAVDEAASTAVVEEGGAAGDDEDA